MNLIPPSDTPRPTPASVDGALLESRFTLWIDGVGAFLLFVKDALTIGGPLAGSTVADLALLANLSRKHATIRRSGEGYLLLAHAATQVGGRTVLEQIDLQHGSEISLGQSVRLRFVLPTVLSGTARLDFLSDHRPQQLADAAILMDETCVLGPTIDSHVPCPGWPEKVLIFRRGNELWCRARLDFFVDGQLASSAGSPLRPGSIVSGQDFRFRLEGATDQKTAGPTTGRHVEIAG